MNGITPSVHVPGSKSYTNRALLIAALMPKAVKIHNPLVSDDTEAMLACLETLGFKIIRTENTLEIIDDISVITDRHYTMNAGLSGTTIRFMLALSAIIPGQQTITGDTGLLKRPIGDLVDALRNQGANIEYLDKEGYPPLRISSKTLNPGTVVLDGTVSSQYLSALLMIAPKVGLKIKIKGKLISKPFVDMTINIMKRFEVSVTSTGPNYDVPRQTYSLETYYVEGDVSSACYFWAIATLTKTTITVQGVSSTSKHADMGFLKILEEMGSKVIYEDHRITVVGAGVQPIYVNMEHCPDQAQTMAVLAAFANGTTTIAGIQSLRVKETERINALQQELSKMGIKTSSSHDSLVIHGGNPRAAPITTYGDHRMAMSFAVASTKLPDLEILNPEVVNKTFPGFWKEFAKVTENKSNIVLIGMRGSGKSTVGRILANKLGKKFIDMDDLIIEKHGKKTSEIVKDHGWEYFRDAESKATQELGNENNCVISAGGGIVIRMQNIKELRKNSVMILLTAPIQNLSMRISADSDRPSILGQAKASDELQAVWNERKDKYYKAADFVIDNSTNDPTVAVRAIISTL